MPGSGSSDEGQVVNLFCTRYENLWYWTLVNSKHWKLTPLGTALALCYGCLELNQKSPSLTLRFAQSNSVVVYLLRKSLPRITVGSGLLSTVNLWFSTSPLPTSTRNSTSPQFKLAWHTLRVPYFFWVVIQADSFEQLHIHNRRLCS